MWLTKLDSLGWLYYKICKKNCGIRNNATNIVFLFFDYVNKSKWFCQTNGLILLKKLGLLSSFFLY